MRSKSAGLSQRPRPSPHGFAEVHALGSAARRVRLVHVLIETRLGRMEVTLSAAG
jgi:hypothetical protein